MPKAKRQKRQDEVLHTAEVEDNRQKCQNGEALQNVENETQKARCKHVQLLENLQWRWEV